MYLCWDFLGLWTKFVSYCFLYWVTIPCLRPQTTQKSDVTSIPDSGHLLRTLFQTLYCAVQHLYLETPQIQLAWNSHTSSHALYKPVCCCFTLPCHLEWTCCCPGLLLSYISPHLPSQLNTQIPGMTLSPPTSSYLCCHFSTSQDSFLCVLLPSLSLIALIVPKLLYL